MTLSSRAKTLTQAQARQLAEAFQHIQSGRTKAALDIAWTLSRESPESPDAQQLLGMCLMDDGQSVLAESAFRTALNLAPDHPLILLNYGALLKRSKDFARAASCFAACARAAPQMAKAWQEFGHCMRELQQFQAALAALEKALTLQPDDVSTLIAIGSMQREMDDLAAAERTLLRVTELSPESGLAWANLGACRRLLGRSDQALTCYWRARDCGLGAPEVADALTGALLDNGQLPDALANARQLVASLPNYVPGQLTLAHINWEFAESEHTRAAPFSEIERAVAASPGDTALREAFARLLHDCKLSDQAIGHVRRLRHHGDSPALALLEAEVLDTMGESAEAGRLFDALAAQGGNSSLVFLTAHARHLLKSGRLEEAETSTQTALQIDPDNQIAWAYLATIWRLLDDPREHWLCDYDRLVALVEVPVPTVFSSREEFLSTLMDTLEPLHFAKREPMQQSLRGGSQTPGRLFGRDNAVLSVTHAALIEAVEHWLATLGNDPQHPFLSRRTGAVRVTGSWSVKLWKSGSHVNHFHPEGWISSAFYVALPESVRSPISAESTAGCIQFGQPPLELGLNLPPRRIVRPEPGKLALFPSYLWHGTVPFEDEAARSTIAFDMKPMQGVRRERQH